MYDSQAKMYETNKLNHRDIKEVQDIIGNMLYVKCLTKYSSSVSTL